LFSPFSNQKRWKKKKKGEKKGKKKKKSSSDSPLGKKEIKKIINK